MAAQMSGKDVVMMSLVRPFTLNFLEPMVFLLNLYIALIYGLLYIWFESFVVVFIEIYQFGLGAEGLAYLGIREFGNVLSLERQVADLPCSCWSVPGHSTFLRVSVLLSGATVRRGRQCPA